ncbi:hypothetical protein M514_11020 [Trichuris suis]|uniref:Uncharacterized protein n=1 Tax=Trichuris suis TaxID=68888 RepID=A0A085MW51_9BILA|nr:hypothetical protein M513_11020 [Trichuris suis]KFD61447.1 hypothetical protein M514_11020 [Trichuris suis]
MDIFALDHLSRGPSRRGPFRPGPFGRGHFYRGHFVLDYLSWKRSKLCPEAVGGSESFESSSINAVALPREARFMEVDEDEVEEAMASHEEEGTELLKLQGVKIERT